MILLACSTIPVPGPVPKQDFVPFPATVMQRCKDLEPLQKGMTGKDLINSQIQDQAQYNDCKDVHNKLIDQIESRIQAN